MGSREGTVARPGRFVRIVGTDDILFQRIISLLPAGVRIERHRSLGEIGGGYDAPILTVCYVPSVSETYRQEIESYLKGAPRRLVVLCEEASPREVYQLAVTGAALGLIAVETTPSLRDLAKRFEPWYWEGLVRPNWTALGAAEGAEPTYYVGRMIKLIERSPFYDWRVEELARLLRISERTLNRSVHTHFGRSTKALLMALRYQLLEQAYEVFQRSWEELAELFGFPSAKELHDWRRAYTRRVPCF